MQPAHGMSTLSVELLTAAPSSKAKATSATRTAQPIVLANTIRRPPSPVHTSSSSGVLRTLKLANSSMVAAGVNAAVLARPSQGGLVRLEGLTADGTLLLPAPAHAGARFRQGHLLLQSHKPQPFGVGRFEEPVTQAVTQACQSHGDDFSSAMEGPGGQGGKQAGGCRSLQAMAAAGASSGRGGNGGTRPLTMQAARRLGGNGDSGGRGGMHSGSEVGVGLVAAAVASDQGGRGAAVQVASRALPDAREEEGFANTAQRFNILLMHILDANIASMGLDPGLPQMLFLSSAAPVQRILERLLCEDAFVGGAAAMLQQLNQMATSLPSLQRGVQHDLLHCFPGQLNLSLANVHKCFMSLSVSVDSVVQSLVPLLALAVGGLADKVQRCNVLAKVISGLMPMIPALRAVLEKNQMSAGCNCLVVFAEGLNIVQQALLILLSRAPTIGGGLLCVTLQNMNDLAATLASLHPTALAMQQIVVLIRHPPESPVSAVKTSLVDLISAIEDVQQGLAPLLA